MHTGNSLMKHFSYTNAKNSNDDIFISWIRQQEIHHYQIFKYHILLIYPQEFSFPFSLLTLFKFLSTRKTIFSIGCRTLFMYPDPRWYGMIPSVWNCRNLKHYLFMIFENLFWISICTDTLSNRRSNYQI